MRKSPVRSTSSTRMPSASARLTVSETGMARTAPEALPAVMARRAAAMSSRTSSGSTSGRAASCTSTSSSGVMQCEASAASSVFVTVAARVLPPVRSTCMPSRSIPEIQPSSALTAISTRSAPTTSARRAAVISSIVRSPKRGRYCLGMAAFIREPTPAAGISAVTRSERCKGWLSCSMGKEKFSKTVRSILMPQMRAPAPESV